LKTDRDDFLNYLRTLRTRWSLNLRTEDAVKHPDFAETSLVYEGPRPREIILDHLEPILEQGDRHLGADHATLSTAQVLVKAQEKIRGKVVCEVGCGTALLSIVCYRLGARRVLATDIDPECLAYARENVKLNRAEVSFFQGNLLECVPRTEPIEVILGNLPQKPSPGLRAFSIAYRGGYDGTALLRKWIVQASERLNRGNHLYLFYHSLANPQVLQVLNRDFDVLLKAWKRRIFTHRELEGILPHISRLKKEGKSFFEVHDASSGQYFFYGMVLEGIRR